MSDYGDVATVADVPGKGLGVVANTAIPSDTVVGHELPVAWAVDPHPHHPCDRCLTPSATPCARCGEVAFCSSCLHHSIHPDDECAAFQRMSADVQKRTEGREVCYQPSDLLLLAKLLYRLHRAVAADPAVAQQVAELSRARAADSGKHSFRARAAKVARVDSVDLCDVIETNCYSLGPRAHRPSEDGDDTDMGSVGIAVYPALSRFNHSCAPNCFKARGEGLAMRVVTACPVREGDELTHSYAAPGDSTGRRKETIRLGWGFECTCSRCSGGDVYDDWGLSRLCSCKGLLIDDPDDLGSQRCSSCGEWCEA